MSSLRLFSLSPVYGIPVEKPVTDQVKHLCLTQELLYGDSWEYLSPVFGAGERLLESVHQS